MGSSVIPAPSGTASDNWVLISSVTPTVSTSTVSFTSIGNYKKLMLKVINPGLSAASFLNITLNSDTGNNYSHSAISYNGTALTAFGGTNGTSIGLSGPAVANTATLNAQITFNETNTTGLKNFFGFSGSFTGASQAYANQQGSYFASAAISTVTLNVVTNTFLASGTVALYGVAA